MVIGGDTGNAMKLRVGSYEIAEGSPRPFVYVPKDFDLRRMMLRSGRRQVKEV